MSALTVALPKGRLLDPALQLLSAMGIQGLEADTRKLLLADAERAALEARQAARGNPRQRRRRISALGDISN